MQLPTRLTFAQLLTRWSSILNPLLANQLNGVQILSNVALIDGVTVINHLLGQIQQGWFLVDVDGAAIIYRSAPFNATNLTLTSNSAVTVSIGVY